MSQKIRPYIALDLETTGLDTDNVQILQIGWVIEDGVSPINQLKTGSLIIKNKLITHGEPFALGMNAWLFQEIQKELLKKETKYPVVGPAMGLFQLACAIRDAAVLASKWDEANGLKVREKVQICGKNPGNFDWQIVIRNLMRESKHELSQTQLELLETARTFFDLYVDHRFVDVGGVFYDSFGRNAGFDEISKLVGMPVINHDALDDAMACVIAIRHRVGMKS